MRKSRAKNIGRRGNSILIVLLQTFGELLATFKYGLIEELDKVAVVLQILIPIVIARTDLSTPKIHSGSRIPTKSCNRERVSDSITEVYGQRREWVH